MLCDVWCINCWTMSVCFSNWMTFSILSIKWLWDLEKFSSLLIIHLTSPLFPSSNMDAKYKDEFIFSYTVSLRKSQTYIQDIWWQSQARGLLVSAENTRLRHQLNTALSSGLGSWLSGTTKITDRPGQSFPLGAPRAPGWWADRASSHQIHCTQGNT